MRVAFRVDGSERIGTGHLRRCESLAQALARLGAQVLFVSRWHDSLHSPEAPAVGPCAWLPPAEGSEVGGPPVHASWAGVPWARDATETLEALARFRPDWLIVDHYALDARWHHRLRSPGLRLAAIDDLADRDLAVDLLIDQNLHADHRAKYAGRIAPRTRVLGGPRYALMSQRYSSARQYAFRESVRSIGIFMGGGDPQDTASMALRACREVAGFAGEIELVSSTQSPHHAGRLALARRWPATEVLADLPDLCDFFARHDLHVGAGGGAAWERCCLGAPTVAFAIADNQEVVLPQLEARGALVRLSAGPELAARLGTCVARLVADPARRLALSRAARDLVDGQGAQRVAAVLAAAAGRPLTLRDATVADEALLLAWANDPQVRRQAFHQGTIAPQTHAAWFAKRLADPAWCRIFVAEAGGGVPAGQVRFERTEEAWEVGYSLDAAFRGWGLGARMLGQALHELVRRGGTAQVRARVKTGNPASAQVFRSLGFVEAALESQPEPCHSFTLTIGKHHQP